MAPGRVRPSLVTELDSFSERRALFEDEETFGTRAERSQIVEDPFREEPIDTKSGVPGDEFNRNFK